MTTDGAVRLDGRAVRDPGVRTELFTGETLRGLLQSAYAWSTVGMIAGIAAIGAFVAAGIMAVLVALGLVHLRRSRTATTSTTGATA